MDWSEGEQDPVWISLFSLSMLANYYRHVIEWIICWKRRTFCHHLAVCTVFLFCVLLSQTVHVQITVWISFLRSLWRLLSHSCPIGCGVVWLGFPHQSGPGHFWAALLDWKEFFRPHGFMSLCITTSVYCWAHNLRFPSCMFDTFPLWAKKFCETWESFWESLTNFSSCLQGVFQLLTWLSKYDIT